MSTSITLPKNTPIVTFCGVASRFMHSIKLTFVDDGRIVKVRKWYGNDRRGRIIGADDLFFEGEDPGQIVAKVKILVTKDRGQTWNEPPCQRRRKNVPARRRKNVLRAGWELVPVVHGRDPRAGRRALRAAGGGPRVGGACGPTGPSGGLFGRLPAS